MYHNAVTKLTEKKKNQNILFYRYFFSSDYVLAYEPFDQDENRRKNRSSKREMFEENLEALGLELETEDVEVKCIL